MSKYWAIIYLAVVLCSHLNNCYAQWEKIFLIKSEDFNCISINNQGYIFAGSAAGSVYRSSDNGESWQNLSRDLPADVQISDIAADGSTIFAATSGSGVYRSINNGVNWSPCNSGISTTYVLSILICKTYILAGTQNGIYKSTNKGINWVLSSSGINFTHGIHSMVQSDSAIFASSSVGASGTVYKSTNNGANWFSANNGLPDFIIHRLAYSNGIVFAELGPMGIYWTSNEGLNWTLNFQSGIGPTSIFAKGDTVLAGRYGGAYVSLNHGFSWTAASFGLNSECTNDFAKYGNTYYCVSTKGIYKSSPGTLLSWFKANEEISNLNFNSVITISDYVLAGTEGFGIYCSYDYGLTWSKAYNIYNYATCKEFVLDQAVIYTYGSYRLLKTTNLGENWIPVGLGLPDSLITAFSARNEFLIACMYGKEIYASANYGGNWSKCISGLPDSMTVTSVFVSDNNALAAVRDARTDSSNLFISSNHGILWNKVMTAGLPNCRVNKFIQYQNKIFAGLENHGIFISSNYGLTWFSGNNGLLSDASITSFAAGYGLLYAGSSSDGVFGSLDSGNSWIEYNEGLDTLSVNSVFLNYSYAYTCGGNNLWKRNNLVGIKQQNEHVPKITSLYQNYPNPFNPVTKIKFSIHLSRGVPGGRGVLTKLIICDALGREVAVLVNENLKPGTYEAEWNGTDYPSGVYFYKLTTDFYSETKKMVLIK